jgi:hypothetical protein
MLKTWPLFCPTNKADNLKALLINKMKPFCSENIEIDFKKDSNLFENIVLNYSIKCLSRSLNLDYKLINESWSDVQNIVIYLFSMPSSEATMSAAVESIIKLESRLRYDGVKTDSEAYHIILLLVGSFLLPTSVAACWESHGQNTPSLDSEEDYRNFVSESLRIFSPSRITTRVVLDDIQIKNIQFKKGETVGLLLAEANRDPVAFQEPLSIKLGRERRPLTFGLGARRCIGERLTLNICIHFLKELKRQGPIKPIEIESQEQSGIHFVKSIKYLTKT